MKREPLLLGGVGLSYLILNIYIYVICLESVVSNLKEQIEQEVIYFPSSMYYRLMRSPSVFPIAASVTFTFKVFS